MRYPVHLFAQTWWWQVEEGDRGAAIKRAGKPDLFPSRPQCPSGDLALLLLGARSTELPKLRQSSLLLHLRTSEPVYPSTSTVGTFSAFGSALVLIWRQGDKLLYSVETYGVVIIVGQTGCGKTTRSLLHCYP